MVRYEKPGDDDSEEESDRWQKIRQQVEELRQRFFKHGEKLPERDDERRQK